VNHFQGRVSCPYGQGWDAKALKPTTNAPATATCFTPGIGTAVTGPVTTSGAEVDPAAGATVKGQCTDRTADKTVYCSCRCADINGTQNNGTFCNCPDGFACTQLVSSLSAMTDQGLTGAYCIKTGTAFGTTATGSGVSACTTCGGGGQNGPLNCGAADNKGGS
jgi:hypothetical protein